MAEVCSPRTATRRGIGLVELTAKELASILKLYLGDHASKAKATGKADCGCMQCKLAEDALHRYENRPKDAAITAEVKEQIG